MQLNVMLVIAGVMMANILAEDTKRLVLHSDADTAAEIIQLKQLVQEMAAKQSDLADRLNRLTSKTSGGSTYIRWGRTTCNEGNASLVYSGYMAGTHYVKTSIGAGANYLCLSNSPQWDYSTTSEDNSVSFTSVEYDFWPHQNSDIVQFLGRNVFGHQVPCAVCVLHSATSLMIPGRTECYPGWNKEYSGYIVSGYAAYVHGTEYVCLDRRPESIAGSENVDDRNLLFFIEAKCQSGLECPPYENGRELACVVCSV